MADLVLETLHREPWDDRPLIPPPYDGMLRTALFGSGPLLTDAEVEGLLQHPQLEPIVMAFLSDGGIFEIDTAGDEGQLRFDRAENVIKVPLSMLSQFSMLGSGQSHWVDALPEFFDLPNIQADDAELQAT